MPGADGTLPEASVVLEINMTHPIADKLKELYDADKGKLTSYAKILYAEACLISGIEIENPKEFGQLISELMV